MTRSRIELGVALLLGGCAYQGASFSIDQVAGFKAEHEVVSVLGAYRDGRMDEEAWTLLGPELSRALGRDACEVFFDERLKRDEPDLFDKLDEDTKQNGYSAEALAPLAARAEGELILTLRLAGRPPQPQGSGTGHLAERTGSVAQRKGHGRHVAGQAQPAPVDDSVLEAYVSLYATRSRRTVWELVMRYSGASVEDATRKLSQRLRELLPGASCAGWKRLPKA